MGERASEQAVIDREQALQELLRTLDERPLSSDELARLLDDYRQVIAAERPYSTSTR